MSTKKDKDSVGMGAREESLILYYAFQGYCQQD